jgi:hypothetical protein
MCSCKYVLYWKLLSRLGSKDGLRHQGAGAPLRTFFVHQGSPSLQLQRRVSHTQSGTVQYCTTNTYHQGYSTY